MKINLNFWVDYDEKNQPIPTRNTEKLCMEYIFVNPQYWDENDITLRTIVIRIRKKLKWSNISLDEIAFVLCNGYIGNGGWHYNSDSDPSSDIYKVVTIARRNAITKFEKDYELEEQF